MKSRTWLRTFSAISITLGLIVCDLVVYIDPYMHYHKPIITKFYYELDSQRYQNDGITKYFDYDMNPIKVNYINCQINSFLKTSKFL